MEHKLTTDLNISLPPGFTFVFAVLMVVSAFVRIILIKKRTTFYFFCMYTLRDMNMFPCGHVDWIVLIKNFPLKKFQ